MGRNDRISTSGPKSDTTIFLRSVDFIFYIPRSTQPPTLCGTRNEYRPKSGNALRLGSRPKGNTCDLLVNTCHSERFRGDV